MENKYEDLEVHTSYKFDPAKSICATYLWTENVGYPKELVTATAYNTEGYKLWFKQGRFPIGIDGEATAHLLDNTPIPVKTLIDSGASRPILNKHFYDAHPFLHTYPRYKIATRGMVIGNDTALPCNEAIAIMVKFSECFPEVFSKNSEDIGRTNLITMDIDTGDHPPICQKPYTLAIKHYEWVQKEVEQLE